MDRSGGSRVLLSLANYLSYNGIIVNMIVPKGNLLNTFDIASNIKIIEKGITFRKKNDIISFLKTLSLVFFIPRGDFIIFSYFSCAYPVIFAKKFLFNKSKIIYFVQGNEELAFGEYAKRFKNIRKLLVRISLKFDFTFFSNSKYIQQFLIDQYNKNSIIAYPGIEEEVFKYHHRNFEYVANSILVIGSDHINKGWDMIVNTLKELNNIRKDFIVNVISKNLNGLEFLERRVNWLKPKDDFDLFNIYKSNKLFFSTSRNEGFGLPVLEAMAIGTPVVSTDSLGVRDLIIDKVNGLIIRYGNYLDAAKTIDFLFNNPLILNDFAAAASNYSKKFTWEKCTQQFYNYLTNMTK